MTTPHHSEPAREAVALLPCPFCGGTNIDPEGWASIDRKGPACDDCSGSADTVEIWNNRPLSASPAPAASGGLEAARELPFGFKAPFHVEVDKDDMVHLCDAEGRVETFNTHTQLPLNRQDLLDEERDEWKAWAELLASSLNAALAAPAATGGEATTSVQEAGRKSTADGKPVAWLRFTHGGYGCELSKHIAYGMPEGVHAVYAHPAPSETGASVGVKEAVFKAIDDFAAEQDALRLRTRMPHVGEMASIKSTAATQIKDRIRAALEVRSDG